MKSMDKPKTADKKKPQKTLKEKRAEKRAKKESKENEWLALKKPPLFEAAFNFRFITIKNSNQQIIF